MNTHMSAVALLFFLVLIVVLLLLIELQNFACGLSASPSLPFPLQLIVTTCAVQLGSIAAHLSTLYNAGHINRITPSAA